MSINTKELNRLIDEQQALLDSIRAEALSIDSEELTRQNERLKQELESSVKAEASLKAENESLRKELSTTRNALFTKMANEKLSAFKHTQQRIESTYYRDDSVVGSKLLEYEKNCRGSINATIKAIEQYGASEFGDILNQLNALNAQVNERRAQVEAYRAEQIQNARKTNFAIGESLKNEPLTETEKRTAVKQKNLESFIGLNVLGKAGIVLFIIGIIMLGRFAYIHMTDVLKGGAIYLLGAVLIAIGEIFHKKEKTIFSTTLISGGVATLYAAAATCYFAFNLYNVRVTFAICIAVTALAIILSNQVKSEVVCAFGAVGGYLPVVAIYMIGFGKAAADITFLPVSSVYFCLLAVVIFAMTYNKKWYAAQFIGYALHLVAIGGIAKCAYSLKDLSGYGYALPLAVAFAVCSFIIYLLMPASKIVRRKPFLTGDSVLLALNTLSGAISVSITVGNCFENNEQANRVVGFVFLAFAVIYCLLMIFSIREKREGSAVATAITSLGALVFSMFVVPLIFGIEYAGIGWAVEGAILAVISINRQNKIPELAGLLCMVLAVIPAFKFSAGDVVEMITFSVILSAFWIYTVSGMLEARDSGRSNAVYIITELLSAYASAGYIFYIYKNIVNSPGVTLYSYFTDCAAAIIAVLAVALVIRTGILKNTASIIASDITGLILFGATFISMDIINEYKEVYSYFYESVGSSRLSILNLVVLFAVNICVELFFAHSVLDLTNRASAPAWLYTLAISVSSLMLTTATMMAQLDIKFSSVLISAVYIAVACVLLFIGFRKRFTVIRSGGLVLILCALAKLCFVDTSQLDSGWKIASYFAFGAILIVISYFYQRFSKKLEADAVAIVEKTEE